MEWESYIIIIAYYSCSTMHKCWILQRDLHSAPYVHLTISSKHTFPPASPVPSPCESPRHRRRARSSSCCASWIQARGCTHGPALWCILACSPGDGRTRYPSWKQNHINFSKDSSDWWLSMLWKKKSTWIDSWKGQNTSPVTTHHTLTHFLLSTHLACRPRTFHSRVVFWGLHEPYQTLLRLVNIVEHKIGDHHSTRASCLV